MLRTRRTPDFSFFLCKALEDDVISFKLVPRHKLFRASDARMRFYARFGVSRLVCRRNVRCRHTVLTPHGNTRPRDLWRVGLGSSDLAAERNHVHVGLSSSPQGQRSATSRGMSGPCANSPAAIWNPAPLDNARKWHKPL